LLKILIVTRHFKANEIGGGAQKSIELLVSELSKIYHVEVLCKITNEQTEWIHKLEFKFLKRISSYDIVYLNSFFSPLSIFFLFLNSTKVISPKGELFPGALKVKNLKKQMWIYFFNKFFKGKLIFHATSTEEKNIIEKYIYPQRTIIAPDIVAINMADNKPVDNIILKIVYISRIDPKKNLLFCVNILSKVKRQVVFNIYGNIGDKKYFEKCISSLKKLPPNINWKYYGQLNPSLVSSTFLQNDLFFFPTLGENFGYIILESLSSYCPVLLSKGLTIFDDLDKFKIGSNIDLAKHMDWVKFIEDYDLIKNQETLERFKKYICNKFDNNKILKLNQNLFNEVLKK